MTEQDVYPNKYNEVRSIFKYDIDIYNAIISHNIDFVTFLMNEYNLEIDLECCGKYNNLESFLIYFNQTNNINHCFVYSVMFDIPSICYQMVQISMQKIMIEKQHFIMQYGIVVKK